MQCSLPSPPSKEGGSQFEIAVITVLKARNNHEHHDNLELIPGHTVSTKITAHSIWFSPLGFKGELEGDPTLESMMSSKTTEPISAENTENTVTLRRLSFCQRTIFCDGGGGAFKGERHSFKTTANQFVLVFWNLIFRQLT